MKYFTLLFQQGGVLSALLLWFAIPLCAQQIVTAIHVQWDNNLTDSQPMQCVTSGEVANPCFYFLVAYKFPIISVTIDWAELQELTQAHSTQPIRQTSFSIQSGLHSGCTQPPVSDPQNWSLRYCGLFPTMGTLLHNSPYRVTVQYRYLAIVGYNPMPIYQTFGPYQTSMEFSVRNLVVSSADEVKVLKWDPDRPEVCDTSFQYTLDGAQTRDVPVRISIYSTDGSKVFEVTEQKRCPLTYTFTWNGRNSLDQPAPPGLYVFDVEANPNAGSSGDTDRLRSSRISVGEHEVFMLPPPDSVQSIYAPPPEGTLEVAYVLRSDVTASRSLVQVYDPDFLLAPPVEGGRKTISTQSVPQPDDWNVVNVSCSLNKPKNIYPYTVVIWAWDGVTSYKNHQPKSKWANQRVQCYTCVHFDAIGEGTNTEAAKEFRSVQFQTYSQRLGRVIVASTDWGDSWQYYDPPNAAPPAVPTNRPILQRTSTSQGWNRDLVFRALESTVAITIMAEGNATAVGTRWSRITANDLWTTYNNGGLGWYQWVSVPGVWQRTVGLSHIRVTAVVGCRTGGAVSAPSEVPPNEPDYYTQADPQPGSVAARLLDLKVKCVVYVAAPEAGAPGGTRGAVLREASKLFLKYFWRFATKGAPNLTDPSRPPTYGSVAAAVLSAKQLIRRLPDKEAKPLIKNAVWYQFFVKGDAALYP